MQNNNQNLEIALRTLNSAMDASATLRLTEGCTLREHALWSAYQAATSREANDELIVASLFHDIGHFVCAGDPEMSDYDKDREHASVGAHWLSRWFPNSVCKPIALHIEAKRYLATVDPGYRASLGDGSSDSLKSQGGLMTAQEVSSFRALEHAQAALLIRRFDDAPHRGEAVHAYDWYEGVIARVMEGCAPGEDR